MKVYLLIVGVHVYL